MKYLLKYKWLLIGLAAFLLLLIIFQPCNKPAKVLPVKIKTDPEFVSGLARKDKEIDSLKKEIKVLQGEKVSTDQLIKKANYQLSGLIVKYNQALTDKDTIEVVTTCSQLVEENYNLLNTVSDYQNNFDEYVTVSDQALRASDSAALYHTRLSTALNAKYQVAVADYNDLSKMYNKQIKKTTRQKNLNRGLAIALGVVGGILILK